MTLESQHPTRVHESLHIAQVCSPDKHPSAWEGLPVGDDDVVGVKKLKREKAVAEEAREVRGELRGHFNPVNSYLPASGTLFHSD